MVSLILKGLVIQIIVFSIHRMYKWNYQFIITEYTMMVDNLQAAFDRLTEKYMHRLSSSDEEIAVEYQLPTPSRKHKLKLSESPTRHKKKKRKSHSDSGIYAHYI